MSNTYVLLFKSVNSHRWVQRWSEELYQRMTISNVGESRWVQMAVSRAGKVNSEWAERVAFGGWPRRRARPLTGRGDCGLGLWG